jgi:GAF domain-containing protein
VTATLPRPHLEMDAPLQPAGAAVVTRWQDLRRVAGLVTCGLAAVSGIVLMWPAMVLVVVLGAAMALDATAALRTARRAVTPTLVVDITLTGVGLVAVAVPPPATGMVVAYYVVVVAVLSTGPRAWPVGLYAVVVGVAASILSTYLDTTDGSMERSLASGIIVAAVFGISMVVMVTEFARVRQRGNETTDRRLEVADAIARASTALVAEDEAHALATALSVVRSAMGVSVVFVERNVHDEDLGLTAVVVERAAEADAAHASLDRLTKVPWSAMPGARAHLEGGAPFFYRVEEARGTQGDRGGELGLRVEVNVPVSLHGDWVGVVGAADEDADRVWRTDDLVLLRTLADLTAAFWHRQADSKVRDTLIGSLDGRLRHVDAIARASRALLGDHAGDLEAAMDAIGTAAGVDEVFISSTIAPDGEPRADVIARWAARGVDPTMAVGDQWTYADHGDERSALQHGELASSAGAGRAGLVAPIEAGGDWFGSVGFVVHRDDRSWEATDEAFLRTFSDMVGAFSERNANRDRLEASLSSKDQLIASVSHELRTPLTVIVGMAEELHSMGDAFDADDRAELLRVISDEGTEMVDLLEDLLVAARSDDGSLPVFPEPVDLCTLAHVVASHLVVPDSHKVIIEDVPMTAYADPVRVRQVVRNLLTNAFRYGGETVTVGYGAAGGEAWIDVHDDGDGIPVEDRQAIFEAYGRSRSSRSVQASVGLGLTLSRRLATIMDGQLRYVEGPGCRFRLVLPRHGPDGA